MSYDDDPMLLALRRLHGELTISNRAAAARLAVTEIDLTVLDLLHREGPQTVGALAQRVRVSPSRMTYILRRLTRDGWVHRRTTPGDLRTVTVTATNTERLAAALHPARDFLLGLLSERTPHERATFIEQIHQAATAIAHATDLLADTAPPASDPPEAAEPHHRPPRPET